MTKQHPNSLPEKRLSPCGRKKEHLGGSKEAGKSSCWNDKKTQISWQCLYWCAQHPVIPVIGHRYKSVSHIMLYFVLHCRDWPTCIFPLPGLPRPSPFLWGKSQNAAWSGHLHLPSFWTEKKRGRALCQVYTPGCGGACASLAPGPGQPEPSGSEGRGSLLRASFVPEAPLISSKKLKTLV